jgi:hypothetical protein
MALTMGGVSPAVDFAKSYHQFLCFREMRATITAAPKGGSLKTRAGANNAITRTWIQMSAEKMAVKKITAGNLL